MGKHIACGDVVSGCGFTAEAATEAELLETGEGARREGPRSGRGDPGAGRQGEGGDPRRGRRARARRLSS